MANQNLKAIQMTAYDCGAGSGNTVTYTYRPPQSACVVGAAAGNFQGGPRITTVAFTTPAVGNQSWFTNPNSAFLGSDAITTPGDMLVKNRSRDYFITLVGTVRSNNANILNVYFPIPPLGEMWLPNNLVAVTGIIGGNPYQPLAPVPTANTQTLTLDYLLFP